MRRVAFGVALLALLVGAGGAWGCSSVAAGGQPRYCVVVDAGHGGIDSGVTGIATGVRESDLNLAVAKELQNLLEGAGFRVVMTRATPAGLYGAPTKGFKRRDMEKRRKIIREANADLVLSVHMNFFSQPDRRGGQTFYDAESEGGRALALCLQKELNALGVREYSPLPGDYYMLQCTEAPSCIAECGFLSHPEEERLLTTESYRAEIAYALYRGVAAFFAGGGAK